MQRGQQGGQAGLTTSPWESPGCSGPHLMPSGISAGIDKAGAGLAAEGGEAVWPRGPQRAPQSPGATGAGRAQSRPLDRQLECAETSAGRQGLLTRNKRSAPGRK